MEITEEYRRYISNFAGETLGKFEAISEAAKNKLLTSIGVSADLFASINTLTATNAIKNLTVIDQKNRANYQTLSREPAIARVVVENDNGEQETYYICRTTPLPGLGNCASYNAPVGRMASLPVGEEFILPNKHRVLVIENAVFKPIFEKQWDANNTVIRSEDIGTISIESLRSALSKATGVEHHDLLDKLLAEEVEAANIIAGVRRNVISKMGLRDQPVLDQYQDEIFRLPLDRRLLILGPPGTGKTTTLIRRLGQKLDTSYLNEDEQHLVTRASIASRIKHSDSWLMFTPTELLKQYLKEAFAREGVPASDHRIRTWADYRRELARNIFPILRTASERGTFVLKESDILNKYFSENNAIEWFTDFDKWQRSIFVQDLFIAAQELNDDTSSAVSELGQRLISILERDSSSDISDILSSIASETSSIQELVSKLKEVTDSVIRNKLNIYLNQNKALLDELADFIRELQLNADIDNDDLDEEDAEEEDASIPRIGRGASLSAYMRAIRAHARAHAGRRKLSKKSHNGRIIEWLGERTLDKTELVEVGISLNIQTKARRFINPIRRYLDGIPRRYKIFRRDSLRENNWYYENGFQPDELNVLELDIILLSILRAANDLIRTHAIAEDIDKPVWSAIRPVLDLYRNQILVDEVADFSPIQLACMASLTNPNIRSFFACGDFNQRLTTWGSRSLDDVKWVFPEIDTKSIVISYRQSKQLNELARGIVKAMGDVEAETLLPVDVDNEGIEPALLEGAPEKSLVISWLAQQICEIEHFIGKLPSIAVFVQNEKEVQPIAEELDKELSAHNIKVVACPNGQVMGQDSDIRVFDIQHIKGLEFEGVFFIDVDRLAKTQPELFDKYLYVGATRAATYLGITCENKLPEAISSLKSMFVSNWQNR